MANAVIVGVLIVQCLLIGIWTAIAADPSDDGFRGERFDWEVSFHSADRPEQQVYEATFLNDQIIVWTSSTTDARLKCVFSTAGPPDAHRFWHSFFHGGVGTPPGSREHQVSCGGFQAGRWLSADQVNRGSFVIAPIPITLGYWYLHVDPSFEAAGVTDDQLPAPGDELVSPFDAFGLT